MSVLAGFLVLALASAAWAESPLVTELRVTAVSYHENPGRIDALKSSLTSAVKPDSDVETLLALAHICFIWGDVRAQAPDEKLAAYEQGRQAAKRAIDLAPRNVLAHFWYAAHTGRWGQTKGVVRSLFLLPTVKRESETVLAIDPAFAPGYALAGNVYIEVPAMFGGDLDRGEEMFRKGLVLAPRFTAMRLGLARTLIKKGRFAEARTELQAILDEKAPENIADWTVKDTRRARELLDSIRDKS